MGWPVPSTPGRTLHESGHNERDMTESQTVNNNVDLDLVIPQHQIWDWIQRILASITLLLLLPVLLFIGIMVRLTSAGPALYTQHRPGYLGYPFKIYKFRTMTVGSDADPSMGLAVPRQSSRVTGIGKVLRKLKLDELPQLWNIVKGEMVFVGPRPIAQVLHDRLLTEIPNFGKRYLVKPGLTNVAQVTIMENLPADMVVDDWQVRFEAEYHYVQRKSVAYDIVVIALTILFILRKAIPGTSSK